MSGETNELQWKLEQMLASSDSEWVDAVTTTVNALYRQFEVEQSQRKLVSYVSGASPAPQLRLLDGTPSHDAGGDTAAELSFVLVVSCSDLFFL
jgi:hypothetical protein